MTENEYSGPTSQEPKPVDPGIYTEPAKRPTFYSVTGPNVYFVGGTDRANRPTDSWDGLCRYCERPSLGFVMIPNAAFVHPQRPNGQPDICRKG